MVESTALEMRHTGNCIVGSTPTLSAINQKSSAAGFLVNADRVSSETARVRQNLKVLVAQAKPSARKRKNYWLTNNF